MPVDDVLKEMSLQFARLYSDVGRPSIVVPRPVPNSPVSYLAHRGGPWTSSPDPFSKRPFPGS
jgi:hypothetical protein